MASASLSLCASFCDLGTARTGAYFSTAPFVGAALAVTALNKPMSMRLLAAATFIVIGVWLHLTETHEHVHGEMEHKHRHRHDTHHKDTHGPDAPRRAAFTPASA